MSATQTPAALAALSLTLETIAAGWLAKHAELAERLIRALAIAKTSGAVEAVAEGTYAVLGSKGERYAVRQGSCTCPDHTQRGAHCKHRLAVSLLAKAGALPQLAETNPQVEFLAWAQAA
jgi:uncharacterized Zn finger protein